MRRTPATRDGIDYKAVRHTNGAVERARELRQDASFPERVVWNILRREGRRLGVVFRRQHPLGSFIADFYCPSAALVVEIDGSMHAHRGEQDKARDEWMRVNGIETVRVRGDEVCRDVDAVCASVLSRARELKAKRDAKRPQ